MPNSKPYREIARSVVWPLLACVLAALTIDAFHRVDDNSRRLANKTAELHAAAYRIDLAISDALPAVADAKQSVNSASKLLQAMKDRLRDAKLAGLPASDAQELTAIVDQYSDIMRREFALIQANRIPQALKLDAEGIAPTFDLFQEKIAHAEEAINADASKANEVATRATFASMALCMAVVVFATYRQQMRTRKQQIARLQALKAAEDANRAKNEFLSRMSHELRTPMNAILGFGQVLQMDPMDVEQTLAVDQIMVAGKHLLSLINEVLDIARIDAGTMSLSTEPVRAQEVVEECAGLVATLAAKRKIEVTIVTSPADDVWIMADKQRLRQCLINLLSNAIKYNVVGGKVEVRCRQVGTQWRAEVKDTGKGIPVELQSRIFVPFDRLGAETTQTEGTGLGLAITQRIVMQMGGSLTLAESTPAGSTFAVVLNLAEAPALPATTPETRTEETGDGQAHRILYIEDNPSNLILMRTLIARRPEFDLQIATSGSVGLQTAIGNPPDLILLDLHLPDMNGSEVLEKLLANPKTASVPVVILSADASPGQIDRLIANGARSYLTKPLDTKLLNKTLDQVMKREDDLAA